MIGSLQTRLVLGVSVLALVAVAAVAFSARQGTRVAFKKFQDAEQVSFAGQPTTRPTEPAALLQRDCCSSQAMAAASAGLAEDEALIVVDSGGDFIAASGPGAAHLRQIRTRSEDGRLTVDAVRERGDTTAGFTLQFRGIPAERLTLPNGRAANAHVIRIPSPEVGPPAADFLGAVDRRLVWATTLVGVLAVAVTWLVSRRIVQPIGELGRAAHDLAGGNLSRRVTPVGSDEIAALARGFNAMASELEHQQTLRRNLVNDVAHELRTPLTSLRCRLETMIDGLAVDPKQALDGANEEVQHLSRLVDDLQELALAEAREIALSTSDVALADVTASAARAAGLDDDPRVRFLVEPDVLVRADATRLRQVILNLLTNADRHTPAAGTITVRAGRASAGEIVLEVHNTGSALTDDQISRVFDRFYRADAARQRTTGGTGLGLAIVKHLVEAQGGRVGAASDASGVGFRVTLTAATGT